MSYPPYGSSGGQSTPWPQYGENTGGVPQGYPGGGPQGYAGGGYVAPTPVVMPPMPSRASGIVALVLGIVMMVLIAPIAFFATMAISLTSSVEDLSNGRALGNGASVTVTDKGSYSVMIGDGSASSCALVDSNNKSYALNPYEGSNTLFSGSDLSAGTYKIQCQGLTPGAEVAGFNGSAEQLANKAIVVPLIWGTVVGVGGLVVMIVGVVLLVKVNGKRRRLAQEAMMAAIR